MHNSAEQFENDFPNREKHARWISEILGCALLLMMALYWINSGLNPVWGKLPFGSALLFRTISAFFLFLLPALFVYAVQRNMRIESARVKKGLDKGHAFLLIVSSAGLLFLLELFYGTLFPGSVIGAGITKDMSVWQIVLSFLSYLIIPPVLEEYFFRGIVLRELSVHRSLLSLMMSSLLFGLMQFSIVKFPLAFLCGLVLGFIYLSTGSVIASASASLCCNIFWFIVEAVGIYAPSFSSVLMRVIFALCTLMAACGIPIARLSFGRVFPREDDAAQASSFWSVSLIIFLILASVVQILFM